MVEKTQVGEFQINEDGAVTCKCGKLMYKVTFPDIGLCWSCKCGEYIVIEDKEEL